MFQDILVTGLVNGSAYALLAIGFSLVLLSRTGTYEPQRAV